MSNEKFMYGNSGTYQTQYMNHDVTVRLFEAPELIKNNSRGIFQAIVTYKCLDTGDIRQELDTLTDSHVDHCREQARELEDQNNKEPWGELFQSYMACVYWSLIK